MKEEINVMMRVPKNRRERGMKKGKPKPEPTDELRELVRVKIDIIGLRQEDVEYLKSGAVKICVEVGKMKK